MAYEFDLEPITNRQTWTDRVEMVDENDAPFPGLATATGGKIQVRDRNGTTVLSGTLTFMDTCFEWTFAESSVRALDPDRYDVGIQFTIGGITYNAVGEIAIEDGVIA